jgi:predicted transporter
MKNKISIGLGCLFAGIPLPTYIHNALNTLQKSNSFSIFDTFHVYGVAGHIVITLLMLITLGLFIIATKELCGVMLHSTPSVSYKKL